jgi:hypothetical protein
MKQPQFAQLNIAETLPLFSITAFKSTSKSCLKTTPQPSTIHALISLIRSQPIARKPLSTFWPSQKIGHLQSETCLVNLDIFVTIVTNQSRD